MILLCSQSSARAAEPELVDKVEQANALYEAGEYDQALELYSLAAADCDECPQLDYNQGLAYYRLRDFENAREKFNTALSTHDVRLEQQAKFNLGNVAYARALEKMTDLQEAIGHARSAIDYYRDALELNREDADARANIEIAQLLIKDLLDKQKQEQEKQQQNQQQQQDQQNEQQQDDQSSEDQQQEQQGESEQDEQKQEQEQDQQQGQDDQQDPQQQEQQQPQQGDEQQQSDSQAQQQQASQQEARQLTEEEAERILQAVRDKEAQRRAELARRKQGRRAPVKKDW